MTKDTIYTHNLATQIVELFEDLLDENGVKLPSPEDDERGEDNGACLYGSVYSDLLDEIEGVLIATLEKQKNGAEVVPYVYE